MPRDRGRRTPTRPTPRRVSPRETARPAATPSPARRAGSIKPFTSGAVLVGGRPPTPVATQPAVPTPQTIGPLQPGQTWLSGPSAGSITGRRAGILPIDSNVAFQVAAGLNPAEALAISQKTSVFRALEQQQMAKAYDYKGPTLTELLASPTFQYITQGPHMPKYSDYAGGGGAGGGSGGGYYQAPRGRSYGAGSGASRVSQARGLGLVNWRIGL